jgi:alpha-ketoglutarate-dependent taurine dioxygenase
LLAQRLKKTNRSGGAPRTPSRAVSPIKHIGAEIRGIDLRDKRSPEPVRAIYQAWLDHLVL